MQNDFFTILSFQERARGPARDSGASRHWPAALRRTGRSRGAGTGPRRSAEPVLARGPELVRGAPRNRALARWPTVARGAPRNRALARGPALAHGAVWHRALTRRPALARGAPRNRALARGPALARGAPRNPRSARGRHWLAALRETRAPRGAGTGSRHSAEPALRAGAGTGPRRSAEPGACPGAGVGPWRFVEPGTRAGGGVGPRRSAKPGACPGAGTGARRSAERALARGPELVRGAPRNGRSREGRHWPAALRGTGASRGGWRGPIPSRSHGAGGRRGRRPRRRSRAGPSLAGIPSSGVGLPRGNW
jgi:hypothetical protein